MPWIQKTKLKPKKNLFTKREERQEIYNNDTWHSLRTSKLIEHPLCEMCEMEGIIKLAEDVHHIYSPFNYSGTERLQYAYDTDNLICLCKECHGKIHGEKKESYLYDIYNKRKSPLV